MMGFFRKLFRRSAKFSNNSILDQMRSGGVSTISTVRVNENTAMNLVAVYAAVRALSEDIASVPFPVYRRLENGGKERDRSHPLYRLLNESPDEEISSMQFREFLVKCLNLWGNSYAEIEFTKGNEVKALHRLDPSKVEPQRTPTGVVYKVDGANGLIPANKMLHIAGLGDGLIGMSPIKHAQQTIAAGLMMDQFASAWFANGSRGSMAFSHPGTLSPEAQKRLRDQISEVHGGPSNSGKVFILEEGLTPHQLSVPAEEAQFLGSRIFTVQEIARMFRVPNSVMQETSNSGVRANTEQEAINYITHSLRPWMVRIEKEVSRKLFSEDERESYFAEHLIDAMLRGEAAARTAALTQQFLNGALTHDEWREIENRNPLPDGLGQKHYVPLNMTTVDKMNEEPEDEPEPVEIEEPEDNPEPAPDDAQGEPPRNDETSETDDTEPQKSSRDAIASSRDALHDAVARMIRREVKAINRASNKPRAFLSSIDDFYQRHESIVSEAILPTLKTYLALTSEEIDHDADDVEGYALYLAEAICKQNQDALLDLSGKVTSDELRTAVEMTTEKWSRDRADEILSQIAT